MGMQRRSLFGFPPNTSPPSNVTTRLVPLTQGMSGEVAWPLQPPGSSISMTNFFPLYGSIRMRSLLSSINTIASVGSVLGITPYLKASGFGGSYWVSGGTLHGLIDSSGSISLASFTSAAGFGTVPLANAKHWQYATVFSSNINENMTLAVEYTTPGSAVSIQALYDAGTNLLRSSYLTGAPPAVSVAVYDSYVLAWGAESFANRIKWCVRGEPTNWTAEGSGFEDLLAMTGMATKIIPTEDGRFYLFTDREIWYGVSAAYPAQFQFYPFDTSHGCPDPATVQATGMGIIYLGSDRKLRMLPKGGGNSINIAPTMNKFLRPVEQVGAGYLLTRSYGVWDPYQRLYYLMYDPQFLATHRGFVINLDTGEWGNCNFSANIATPIVGCPTVPVTSGPMGGYTLFANSKGTVFVSDYSQTFEGGSTIQATWQSAPIATDLPSRRKQVVKVAVDYQAMSPSTLQVLVAGDGQNFAAGDTVLLSVATNVGHREIDLYDGGPFPMVQLATTSRNSLTIHRMDVTFEPGGRA